MRKKILFWSCVMAAMLAIAVQPTFAQQYVLKPQAAVDVRRASATSGTPGYIGLADGGAGNTSNVSYSENDINSEFGAGETSTISNGKMSVPNTNRFNTDFDSIMIGSKYSQNIVINTYNAGGYASEFLNFRAMAVKFGGGTGNWDFDPNTQYKMRGDYPPLLTSYPSALGSNPTTYSPTVQNPWGNYEFPGYPEVTAAQAGQLNYNISERNMNLGALNGIFETFSMRQLTDYESYNKSSVWLYLGLHTYKAPLTSNPIIMYQVDAITTKLPYTTTLNPDPYYPTTDSTDNGVKLVQVAGDEMVGVGTNSGTPPSGENMKKYVRPTTVAIEGSNTNFSAIYFEDLQWWYRTHTISGSLSLRATVDSAALANIWCAHVDRLAVRVYEIGGSSLGWNTANAMGNTFLNSAVQLLDGASVCVKGNVIDATDNPGSEQINTTDTTRTNAMLVVPYKGFSLLVAGNYDQLKMFQETSVKTTNNKYTYATFPMTGSANVYLNQSAGNTFDNRDAGLLPNSDYHTNVVNANTNALSSGMNSSIFGVYGSYIAPSAIDATMTQLNANIHTSDNAGGSPGNHGTIEIGHATAGQEHFFIHSGGILKNFVSSCYAPHDSIVVGAGGKAPTFKLDAGAEPLYILNDGGQAKSAIIFKTPALGGL